MTPRRQKITQMLTVIERAGLGGGCGAWRCAPVEHQGDGGGDAQQEVDRPAGLRVHLPGGVVPHCGDHTNAGEFKLRAATLPERDHILPKPFRELCSPTTPGEIAPEPPPAGRDAVW